MPGHITPRDMHGGIAPYEFLALDLKTDLPKTRHSCSICMIIVYLYSMRRHTVALSHKSDESEALQHFISKIVNGQGYRTRRIRVDISGEQTSNAMVDYLVDKGIAKEQVPHAHSPQSYPAERQLQTLFRRILVIKLAAQLPNWLWDELAEAVNHVDAALPVRDNPGGASPIAMITGTRPSAASFKVLGCLCFVHTPVSSLESKTYQGTVVGYARDSVGLRVLVAGVHFRHKRAIIESNSVICHEGIRGINGTSFDSNIIITTTDGFDDFGTWDN